MNQFITVTLEEKDKLKWYLEKSRNQSCDFSLGYNYIWNFQERLSYLILNEILVFRYLTEDTAIYRMSEYNEHFENIISVILKDCQETGKKLQISLLNQEIAQTLEAKSPQNFCLKEDRNNWDYVYSVSDLSTLSGRKYHGKRNHINKFLKEHTYTYEPITKETIPECISMAEVWLERKQQLPGLYPLMNQHFAANHLSGYTYVNREEDMGLPGLRKAKLSYYPAFMVEKYLITSF